MQCIIFPDCPASFTRRLPAMPSEEHPFRIGFLIHDVSRLRRTVLDAVPGAGTEAGN
jgi:hypothetical protein